mgnify:CR=1 FL=1
MVLELGVELATVSWSQVVIFLLLALGISFLCSLLEAVLLSANWTYIEKLAREGRSSGPLLRRFKEDVREVQSGFECGIGLSDYQDLKHGDVIETYENREVVRT